MANIIAMTGQAGASVRTMGLRRALLSRRANLGDCFEARSVLARVLRPGLAGQPACVVPLPRTRRGEPTNADLAVDAGRRLMDRLPQLDADAVGAVVYCHVSPDARLAESTVGRIQHELALDQSFGFSVSQAHNTAALLGIDIAIGLIDGPESLRNVLLVASDTLLYGTPPHRSDRMVWGDAAAAAMLSRDDEAGWRVLSNRSGRFALEWRDGLQWNAEDLSRASFLHAELILEALQQAGLDAGQVDVVVTDCTDAQMVERTHLLAGIADRHVEAGAGVRAHFSSCADTLVRLSTLAGAVAPGAHVLAWSHGSNGEFCCLVLEWTR